MTHIYYGKYTIVEDWNPSKQQKLICVIYVLVMAIESISKNIITEIKKIVAQVLITFASQLTTWSNYFQTTEWISGQRMWSRHTWWPPDDLALLPIGVHSSLAVGYLPLFEAATLSRTPSEDLNIFTPGDLTKGSLPNGDLVTLWLTFLAEREPPP